MRVSDRKKLEDPFTATEIRDIFDRLRTANDVEKSSIENTIYKAYLPHINWFAKQYKVAQEDAMDLYADEFSSLFDRVWNGKLSPEKFSGNLMQALALGCFYKSVDTNRPVEESLADPKIAREATVATYRKVKDAKNNSKVIADLTSVLDEIKDDEELLKQYKIERIHILLIKDYFGINDAGKGLNIAKLAQKYFMSEMEVNTKIRSGLMKIREIQEITAIRSR